MNETEEQKGEIVSSPSPRLNALEKLYVRTYLSTLSHPRAYEAVNPGLKKYLSDNPYANRENVKFHISLRLQEKAEALTLSPEVILTQLYKEATREGAGSNHAARIQALQILGKHLGMFAEKKEDTQHVINIINYGSQEIRELEIPQGVTEEKIPELSIENTVIIEEYNDIHIPTKEQICKTNNTHNMNEEDV